MFLWGIGAFICGSISVGNFQSIKESGSTATRWILGIVFAILAIFCLVMAVLGNMDTSEWSKLSSEEQDIIRNNVQWGHDIGVLD